jgi:hypothetical protein
LVAFALHGLLLFLTRTRRAHVHARPQPTALTRQELVEVDEPTVEPPSPSTPSVGDTPQSGSRAASAPPSVATRVGNHASESEAPVADAALGSQAAADAALSAGVVAAGSAQASAAPPARKIDFGIDTGFFMRPPSEQLPRVQKPEFQRQLEASLSADDVRRGLARGNALLGSLNAAVRDVGPVRGEALLSVTVGADGSLSAVEFLRGSASEWASALESFRRLAASKRVRVPAGAHGLRVTFSVQAKVQRPSGKAVDASGVDIAPPGLALRGTFDVADVGTGAQRLVYARVVSEEVL